MPTTVPPLFITSFIKTPLPQPTSKTFLPLTSCRNGRIFLYRAFKKNVVGEILDYNQAQVIDFFFQYWSMVVFFLLSFLSWLRKCMRFIKYSFESFQSFTVDVLSSRFVNNTGTPFICNP